MLRAQVNKSQDHEDFSFLCYVCDFYLVVKKFQICCRWVLNPKPVTVRDFALFSFFDIVGLVKTQVTRNVPYQHSFTFGPTNHFST